MGLQVNLQASLVSVYAYKLLYTYPFEYWLHTPFRMLYYFLFLADTIFDFYLFHLNVELRFCPIQKNA